MEKHTEEVDLFYVVKKLKNLYHLFLVKFYETLNTLWNNKLIITVLITSSIVTGHFYQSFEKKEYSAEMIVSTNAGSTHSIYEAIKTLNNNSTNKDFLVKNGFGERIKGEFYVTIEPIVSFSELLRQTEPNDRNVETFISRIELEEDVLSSEMFLEQYFYHRIQIFSTIADITIINKVQNYLNSNPMFEEILKTTNLEREIRLEENVQTISLINQILKNLSNEKRLRAELKVEENELSMATIADIIEAKESLLQTNAVIKDNLLKSKEILLLFNKPEFQNVFSFDKRFSFPLFTLFIYFGFFWLKGLYLKGKKHTSAA